MFGFFANASSAVESAASHEMIDQCIECLDYTRKVRSIIERHFNNFKPHHGVENQDTNDYIKSDRGKQVKAFLDFSKKCYKIFGLTTKPFKKDTMLTGKIEDFQWLEHACKAVKTDTVLPFKVNEDSLENNTEELLNMIYQSCDNIRRNFCENLSESKVFFNTREKQDFYEDWQFFIGQIGTNPSFPIFREGDVQELFETYYTENIAFFHNKRMEMIEKIRTNDDMQKVLDEMYILSIRFFFDISCDWIEYANAILRQPLIR